MRTINFKGDSFLLENISSARYEKDRPAKLEMNAFSMSPPAKRAYLIITHTDGHTRTVEGPDADLLRDLFAKAGIALESN
jgi:hypothetical protein